MKILKLAKIFSFLFMLSLVIVSCSKDPVIEEEIIPGEVDPTEEVDQNSLLTRSISNADGLNLDCIQVLYPFDLLDNNGDTHTISSPEDFVALLDPESDIYIVDFVYPIDIADEDGNESTVENDEELGEAFANCLPNGWDENAFPAYLINAENSCWNLQYPVSVSDWEGNISTYDDEESFVDALAEESLFFVFPMTLVNEEGETIVANDIEELLTALFDCNGLIVNTTIWNGGTGFDFIGCYELTFPFSVILPDGTTVEVNDHMEYCDLLLEGNIQEFAFPMTLINPDGEEVVANSQEELDELLEVCSEWGGPGEYVGDLLIFHAGATDFGAAGMSPCYEISFPLNTLEIDSEGNVINEVTLNNMEELDELMQNPISFSYSVAYPATVTLLSTNEVIELQNLQELIEILSSCQ